MAEAQEDTVVQIEKLLAQVGAPESPKREAGANAEEPPKPKGYVLGKFLHSTKQLVEKKNRANADAEANAIDESFIEYSKAASLVFATTANGLNIFGASLTYMLHDFRTIHLGQHLSKRPILAALALSFLPLTLLTAGLAHSVKPRANHNAMMNIVAVLLIMETIYMAAMCTLFGYYLIPGAALSVVATVTCFAAIILILIPFLLYSRPGNRAWLEYIRP